jgi:hypothetical protein
MPLEARNAIVPRRRTIVGRGSWPFLLNLSIVMLCVRMASAGPIEELVRNTILHRLSGPDLLARVTRMQTDRDHHELMTALGADEEALAELETDYYADRAMSKSAT